MWGTNPSLLREKHLSHKLPRHCVLLHRGWFFFLPDLVFAFPTHLDVVLLFFIVESSSSSFQIFVRGKWSICSCVFGVSMGRGGFRFFLSHHLGLYTTPGVIFWEQKLYCRWKVQDRCCSSLGKYLKASFCSIIFIMHPFYASLNIPIIQTLRHSLQFYPFRINS